MVFSEPTDKSFKNKELMKALVAIKNVWYTLLFVFISMVVYAQDKKVELEVDVDKGGDAQWYAHPVAWVIGAAIFILLLVAIVRGKK
jgi:hypothetical protein